MRWIIIVEVIILLALAGAYFLYLHRDKPSDNKSETNNQEDISDDSTEEEQLSAEEQAAIEEEERLHKEIKEREDLIAAADQLVLSYDYDGAIELIKGYKSSEGDYSSYTDLVAAIEGYEEAKSTLKLYGGSYTSVTQVNHIFFHSLIADNSKAFDDDYTNAGYNMYMTTTLEFERMIQKLYEDGYVLVSMHDLAKEVTLEDGTTKFEEAEIYLPEGKKPLVLSQDDLSYYEYMDGDGFASRMVIDENGNPTCEMILDDGSTVNGAFDMIPIVDEFVKEHPDFSYKGAKGIIALTGYEGILGYRTNDPESATYEQDKETVKELVKVLKADGWEFASHSWGHRNSQEITVSHFITDTKRWLDEVGTLVGPTDVYIFPKGIDIETTMGHYESEKYQFFGGSRI